MFAALLSAVTLAAAPRAATAPQPSRSAATSNSGSAIDTDVPPTVQMGEVHFDVRLQAFADTYVGMTHFDTHTVQIDPASTEQMRRQVYLHELMHVAWHQGKASRDKARKYTEEEAIQALAPGLLKLLAENPQAVEYLRK